MGLDVYLYRITDKQKHANWKKAYLEYESRADKENLDEDAERELRLELGLEPDPDEVYTEENCRWPHLFGKPVPWYDCPWEQPLGIDSTIDPDHMFKIGYFRSSYNESGINYILRDRIGIDLYEIFGASDDGEDFYPDWTAARARAGEALLDLRRSVEETDGVRVARLYLCPEGGVKDGAEALKVFMKIKRSHEGTDYNFSNRAGHFFFHKPYTLLAILPGKDSFFGSCCYAVFKTENEERTWWGWYITALKIVIETCDYVLASDDPSSFYMSWSG